MFNLFKTHTARDYIKEASDNYLVPGSQMTPTNTTQFMVGVNTNGSVNLQVKSTTITMSPAATKQLIRQLTAALADTKE